MFVFLLLCIFSIGSVLALSPQYYAEEGAYEHFINFQKKYNISYNNMEEQIRAFQTFKDNLETINRLNKKSKHAVFGITRFADLTFEEFAAKYTGLNTSSLNINKQDEKGCTIVTDTEIPDAIAPDTWDWKTQNVVSSVKDQLLCGSCWAFSAVGCLESQYAMKYGRQVDLSEQQLVDCDSRSHGCTSGVPARAFMSVMEQGGIVSEEAYLYTAQQGQCNIKGQAVLKVTECFTYTLRSQDKVKQLLHSNGPVVVGVQGYGFQHWQSGILTDEQCDVGEVNHAVLLVGYGYDSQHGLQYWTIKNSWGTDHGENGYFRFQRGDGAKSCGMMNNHIMASAKIA